MSVVKKKVVQPAGSLQVCAGQVAGVGSAIQSMFDLFERDNSAALLQIDATNSFNSLNCNMFLNNIKVNLSGNFYFVISCYTLPSHFSLKGK